jgi:three-Cys-motif partner protein
MDDDAAHEFGGEHTQEKLESVGNYLPAYTTALGKLFTLCFVDAFAGTGECDITVSGKKIRVQGSASIALDCAPPFHKLFFVEKIASRARALRKLAQRAQGRNISIVQGDANVEVPTYLATLSRSERAVVLLDPYGMTVEWATLKQIAATKLADVCTSFP